MSVREHKQIARDAERRAALAAAAGEHGRAADLYGRAARAHAQLAQTYGRWAVGLACVSMFCAVLAVLS